MKTSSPLYILFLMLTLYIPCTFALIDMAESSAVFLTSMPPSSGPVLVAPEYPNTDVLSRRAWLIWERMENTLTYNVQVATDWEFNNIVRTYTGITDTLQAADVPSGNTSYYWRVSGTNRAGTGSYGNKRDFKTSVISSIDVGEDAAPTMTDIDGDGLLDMLVGSSNGKITRYEQMGVNSTSFTFITSSFSGIDVGSGSTPAVADIDGDGLLDLIIGRGDGTLQHYEQSSARSATFSYVGALSGIDAGSWSKPTFTDIDWDGRLDLLVGSSNGDIYHYEQNAQYSTSFSFVSASFNAINIGRESSPMFCFYDSGSNLELFIGNEDGKIQLYDQSGIASNSFAIVATNWKDVNVGAHSILAQADLDGNKYVDLLVGSEDGIVGYKNGENYRIDTSMATDAAENIGVTSADLGGSLSNTNGVPVQRRGVLYSTTNPPTMTDNMVSMGSVAGTFSETVSVLSPNTTYYFRTFGSNCYGTFYGTTRSFTTDEGDPRLAVKVFLEGAYDDDANDMRTDLAGKIPATSPHADSRDAGSIPAGITDWVCLELRETSGGAAVYSRSFLLRGDGYLAEDDGAETGLTLAGVTPGDYFIVVRHRNHLDVMSAAVHGVSSTLSEYDFTTGPGRFYGGEAARLETGSEVYGMFGGDCDGNETVTFADKDPVNGNVDATGYHGADAKLNGTVTFADKDLVNANVDKTSHVGE